MSKGISAINEEVKQASGFVKPLFTEMSNVIVGQQYLVERLVIGLLTDGHVLLEGVPGLAKTLAVKSLATSSQAARKHVELCNPAASSCFFSPCVLTFSFLT